MLLFYFGAKVRSPAIAFTTDAFCQRARWSANELPNPFCTSTRKLFYTNILWVRPQVEDHL
jgi:hypothetical protein